MENDPKILRRRDGTPYDRSKFNVRQYEEAYGPGGVPEGYSMAAITPIQDPNGIRVLTSILALMGGGMFFLGFYSFTLPDEAETGIWSVIVGLATLGMAWSGLVIAGRRQRWLASQAQKPKA